MKQILKNMIKQNDNGTVTVTFRGNKDENGNPKPITITNAEIATSYRTIANTLGGSSDPDSVALELAFMKYSQSKNQIKIVKQKKICYNKYIQLKTMGTYWILTGCLMGIGCESESCSRLSTSETN